VIGDCGSNLIECKCLGWGQRVLTGRVKHRSAQGLEERRIFGRGSERCAILYRDAHPSSVSGEKTMRKGAYGVCR